MANLNVSPALDSAIQAILQQRSITEFTVDLQITNLEDATYSFSPLWIDSLTITQSFANDVADRLVIDMQLPPQDYMNLFANSKGLQASLRIIYYDAQAAQRVYTPAPIARTYKAMLVNPQDLSKKHTTGSLMPSKTMPLVEQHVGLRIPTTLHLIESSAYTLRQQQFHGIYKSAKVADVINHIAQSFSIKQLYLVPPDNTMAWDHLVVPPAQGISEVFDYLQYTYGVYMKGMDWYYTNNILYIYPAYENNPKIPHTADIYNAPAGSLSGMPSYHYSLGSTAGIVSTTPVKTKDASQFAAENVGTAVSFTRASTLIDNFSTTNAKGTFINNNNALTVASTTDRTMSTAANNPRHTKTTDNIFEASAQLAKWNAVLIECGWTNAVPYLLYPGHNLKYHYDKQGRFTTQQGILEQVVYHFKLQRRTANGTTYAGNAVLNFRADSDVTNTKQTTPF